MKCKSSYQCYDRQNKLIQVLDARRAQVLISRRLLIGKVDHKDYLVGFWLAPGVTASQIKNVMRLKPARICISNPATVVRVGPMQYWHVPLLPMLKGKGLAA